jgi:hypothetical protein
MRKILIAGVLAVLPLSSAVYGQFLGEGTGGYMARHNGPSGAMGAGHGEGMGFGLLATRSCWPDAEVGCNAIPNPPAAQPVEEPAPAAEPAKSAKKKK